MYFTLNAKTDFNLIWLILQVLSNKRIHGVLYAEHNILRRIVINMEAANI